MMASLVATALAAPQLNQLITLLTGNSPNVYRLDLNSLLADVEAGPTPFFLSHLAEVPDP